VNVGGFVGAFVRRLLREPWGERVDGVVGEDDGDGVDQRGIAAGRFVGGEGEKKRVLEVGSVAVRKLGERLREVGVLDVVLEVLVNARRFRATKLGAVSGVDRAVRVGLLFDLRRTEFGELEGAGFDEDGVFGLGRRDLREGCGFGRDDEGVAAFVLVGERADGEGFGGGIDPERLGVRPVGGNVNDRVIEEADAGKRGAHVGAGAHVEEREVGLDAGCAEHGDE
jgi:hypothetical protein